jgi:hypothetical protein
LCVSLSSILWRRCLPSCCSLPQDTSAWCLSSLSMVLSRMTLLWCPLAAQAPWPGCLLGARSLESSLLSGASVHVTTMTSSGFLETPYLHTLPPHLTSTPYVHMSFRHAIFLSLCSISRQSCLLTLRTETHRILLEFEEQFGVHVPDGDDDYVLVAALTWLHSHIPD